MVTQLQPDVTQVDIKDNSWSFEAGLRTCQNNSSSIRYGGKDISFIRKNGHILRGGEHMQVKGLFLNYKKNRRLMQYFFKMEAISLVNLPFERGKILFSKGFFYLYGYSQTTR